MGKVVWLEHCCLNHVLLLVQPHLEEYCRG